LAFLKKRVGVTQLHFHVFLLTDVRRRHYAKSAAVGTQNLPRGYCYGQAPAVSLRDVEFVSCAALRFSTSYEFKKSRNVCRGKQFGNRASHSRPQGTSIRSRISLCALRIRGCVMPSYGLAVRDNRGTAAHHAGKAFLVVRTRSRQCCRQ